MKNQTIAFSASCLNHTVGWCKAIWWVRQRSYAQVLVELQYLIRTPEGMPVNKSHFSMIETSQTDGSCALKKKKCVFILAHYWGNFPLLIVVVEVGWVIAWSLCQVFLKVRQQAFYIKRQQAVYIKRGCAVLWFYQCNGLWCWLLQLICTFLLYSPEGAFHF